MRKDKLLHIIYFLIMLFMLIALIDSAARSEPYLTYDPNPPIEIYEVEIDGTAPVEVKPALITENDYQLVYDCVNLSIGSHAIRARAKYVDWGWSPWSEIFHVNRPGPLTNPQITINPPLP